MRVYEVVKKNVEGLFPNRRVTLTEMFKTTHSHIYVIRLEDTSGESETQEILAKYCKSCSESEITHEFESLRAFSESLNGTTVRSPKPIHVDAVNRIILMEHMRGRSLKNVLLSLKTPNKDYLNEVVDLAADALAEFHRIFPREREAPLTVGALLDDDFNLEECQNLVNECGLKRKSKAFVDFAAWNMLVDGASGRGLSLIDFPGIDCTFTPHLDLARFRFSLEILRQHPQFKLLRLQTWDLDTIFDRLLTRYSNLIESRPNESDFAIIRLIEQGYARRLSSIYEQGTDDLRKMVEGIYMSDFLNRFADRKKAVAIASSMKCGSRRVTIIASSRPGINARQLRIARSLIKNGYAVDILAWDRQLSFPTREEVDGVDIKNFRLKTPVCLGSFGISVFYVFWWVHVFRRLVRSDADVYHAENLYSAIPAILAKKLTGKKVVYDLVDYVADSFEWPGPARTFLAWLENRIQSLCEGTIVVDVKKQDLDMSQVQRFTEVTNCPEDIRDQIEDKRSQNHFVIYYGGWITETRGIRQVYNAVSDIIDVRLVIAGSGDSEGSLRREMSGGRVSFLGLVSPRRSLEMTANANVVFAMYDPRIPINRRASPAKLYDAMMCRTPVLVNKEASLVAQTVENGKCGMVVPYEDIDSIRNAILLLKENPQMAAGMGANARKLYEERFNWRIMESRLLSLYEEITGD